MVKNLLKLVIMSLIVMGLSVPALAKDKFELEFEKDQEAVKLVRDTKAGGYEVISAEELKKLIDSKKDILIVDTMPYEDSYKKNHIPGAKQLEFPIPEMKSLDDRKKAELVKLLGADKNRLIVFYCGFTKCTRSHNAAMWAVKLGYKNVYRQPGGIKAWKEADYQVGTVK